MHQCGLFFLLFFVVSIYGSPNLHCALKRQHQLLNLHGLGFSNVPNPAVVQVHISGIRALAAAEVNAIRAVDRVMIRGWIKTYQIYPHLGG